ncbi:MAG: hypothetical protein VX028_01340 [Nanoarchaeota archaeon]|nr:hypothetical protein [Nanoarchaeota archaeon]
MSKENFFSSIKNKFSEFVSEQITINIKSIQKNIIKSIEKQIERKVRKIVKKVISKTLFLILTLIGVLFLSYGIIEMILVLLALPVFLTPIIYGSLLILVGLVIYGFS